MPDFQSFVMDSPGSTVIHSPKSPENARCQILVSPGDLRVLGLLLERIASTPEVFSESECIAATILNFWMEKAYFSFTEEEREASEAARG